MTAKPFEPVVAYLALGRPIDTLDILKTHHFRMVEDVKSRIMGDARPSRYSWLQKTPVQSTANKNKQEASHPNRNRQHEMKPLEQITQPRPGMLINKKARHASSVSLAVITRNYNGESPQDAMFYRK